MNVSHDSNVYAFSLPTCLSTPSVGYDISPIIFSYMLLAWAVPSVYSSCYMCDMWNHYVLLGVLFCNLGIGSSTNNGMFWPSSHVSCNNN